MNNLDDITYDLKLLEQSRVEWERSPGLRLVYATLYGEIRRRVRGTHVLEIGSGIGVSKQFFDSLVTSDVVQTPYVDRAASAYALEPPDAGKQWDTIFAVDVLHHLVEPIRFFESAANVLVSGGRIILVEPAATPFGRLFYKAFHHEPIHPEKIQPPFTFASNGPDGTFANMGMGVGLFERHRSALDAKLAKICLSCTEVTYRDVFAYPLTGGYSKPQLLPTIFLKTLLRVEDRLPCCVRCRVALRMVIVLEKSVYL